jgi:hypothetical protein
MKIDTEHLHHWMQAIRQSPDPVRTLDAFWAGQIKSKEWLIDNLKRYVDNSATIAIFGGWVGTLASMLFQSDIPVKSIISIDIDPECKPIADMMNKPEEMAGKFTAVTANMCHLSVEADIVINTSCEHLDQDQYNIWLDKVDTGSLVVLQSNNYLIDEHIRTANSLNEFIEQSNINVVFADILELPLYTRYMIIGRRHV